MLLSRGGNLRVPHDTIRCSEYRYIGCKECCDRCVGSLPWASLIATILLYMGVALFCGCGHEALSGTVTILQNYFEVSDDPLHESNTNGLCRSPVSVSLRNTDLMLRSSDSGAFSIEHYT
uniref:Neuronal membrane glycoprotein M6-a n=1 Tax=Knipowitschia caucasica TaxID=637954 RepID=A0AAV2LQZ9_KNICA